METTDKKPRHQQAVAGLGPGTRQSLASRQRRLERSGVHRTTLHRWIRKTRDLDLHWKAHIPTLSSVPPHRSNELPPEIVAAIVAERKRSGRGAYFVHLDLLDAGVKVAV